MPVPADPAEYALSLWVLPYAAGAALCLWFSVEAVRVPFRKTYHLLLAAFAVAVAVFMVSRGIAATATSASAYKPLEVLDLSLIPLLLALAYHLAVSYASVSPGRVARYSVIASYGVMLIFWGALLLDQGLLVPGAVKNSAGLYVDARGQAEPLILAYWVALLASAFYVLVRFYLRLPENIVKRQTRYLALGFVTVTVGATTLLLSRDLPIFPLDWLLMPVGIAIVLVGNRKHGFAVVTASEEAQSPAPPKYVIPVGRTYLSVEPEARGVYETFVDLVKHGHQGLCVTRTFPDNVRETYDLETTPIRWLAQSAREDAIAPTDLVALSMAIKSFVQGGSNPVVMLQGLEYLVTNNGFGPTLTLVQRLNDVVAEKRAVLLLPLVPRSLDEKEEALLASECARLPQA